MHANYTHSRADNTLAFLPQKRMSILDRKERHTLVMLRIGIGAIGLAKLVLSLQTAEFSLKNRKKFPSATNSHRKICRAQTRTNSEAIVHQSSPIVCS